MSGGYVACDALRRNAAIIKTRTLMEEHAVGVGPTAK